jgi:hypothetical protein
MSNPWRIVIHSSRYSGVYERGTWFAMCLGDTFPEDSIGDDISCVEFFETHIDIIGVGNTPDEALMDLLSKNIYAKRIHEKYVVHEQKWSKSWVINLKLFVARLITREFR